ncbi:MAG: alpha-amylase family glycosyl hydrolase [Pseudomonadota bacterium]
MRLSGTRVRQFTAALLIASCGALHAESYQIVGTDPPSWWVGMADREVQVMVYGPDIAALEPALAPSLVLEPPRCTARDGKKIEIDASDTGCIRNLAPEDALVELTDVKRTDNSNYVFLTFSVGENAPSQSLQIDFELDGNIETTLLFPLLDRHREAGDGFSSEDVIYLVTPDRFVNGDPANDTVAGYDDTLNRDENYGRHGGDLQGVIDRLDYIHEMGFTQLWLNPVLENAQPQWSYHGYAITDHYRVDPRFGDNALYQTLANSARERGMGLIIDIVLNHIGNEHEWMRDLPASDWINYGGEFVGTNHQREALHDPYASEDDRQRFADGWFVPTMPDLNQRNPLLARYLIQHSIWWIEYAGLSGIRVDTWPYSDKAFLTEYARAVREEYPDINIVGEEWTTNPSLTAYWQAGSPRSDSYESHLPSVFDFPLQAALVEALNEPESWSTGLVKIYRTLANDFLYGDPNQLVTFPDNHDMSRVFTQLDGNLDRWKQAHAILLTTRGIPQLYYGSEILFANPDSDSHGVIRKEFSGGWPDHTADAVTGEGLTDEQREAQSWLRKLLNWRKSSPAAQTGKLTHFAPRDGIYAFRRDAETGTTIVTIINKNDTEVSVDRTTFAGLLPDTSVGNNVMTGASANAERGITVPANGATILEFVR